MNIKELQSSGQLYNLDGKRISKQKLRELEIDPEATFAGELWLGSAGYIGKVAVGARCKIGYRTIVGYPENWSYIGDDVEIGEFGEIEDRVAILRGVKVGKRVIMRAGVIIAEGLEIPDTAQFGSDVVIASLDVFTMFGPVGAHRRYMTIHGSDEGERFSAGCQDSIDWLTFTYRVYNNIGTTPESAADYQRKLSQIKQAGEEVQAKYEQQADQVRALREMVAPLIGSPDY